MEVSAKVSGIMEVTHVLNQTTEIPVRCLKSGRSLCLNGDPNTQVWRLNFVSGTIQKAEQGPTGGPVARILIQQGPIQLRESLTFLKTFAIYAGSFYFY